MDSTAISALSRRPHQQLVDDLAASCGIEPEYQDNWGQIQPTSLETKKSILRAIGLKADTQREAEASWRKRESHTGFVADPVIVAAVSHLPKALVVQVPRSLAGESGYGIEGVLTVTNEQGGAESFPFTAQTASHIDTIHTENDTYDCWSIPFPPLETMGYFRFHVVAKIGQRQRSGTAFVAVCPDKAYLPPALHGEKRVAGVAISLYGVRSGSNWGIGDFGDLTEIVDWVVDDLHGSILGLNPLHATFNRRPFNTSPYLPMSRFYRNFIYIDVPATVDYEDAADAQDFVNSPSTRHLLSGLRASSTVRYEEVAALKEEVLRRVFGSFLANHWKGPGPKTERRKGFEEYIESEGLFLDNFATFCALDAFIRSKKPDAWTWRDWPQPYQRPDTDAVKRFREEHGQEILFHKWVQWQIETQLDQAQAYAKSRGMQLGLYHDLALAADRFSADFWAYQDFYFSNLRVGAPPDAFSQLGQDWGVPPPNMEAFREAGYGLFIKEIEKSCRFGGALRIDHVMRFFHLFCIPEGDRPAQGAYLSQPFEELLGIVSLESVRSRTLIIGEDLGTVPGYVREKLREKNILSYRLLYFERENGQRFLLPHEYPDLALVTVSTHDLPTLTGFWSHADVEIRKQAGMFEDEQAIHDAVAEREADKASLLALLIDLNLVGGHGDRDVTAYPEITGELHHGVVEFLASTPSKIFMLTQEDLFKDVHQQNLPGSTTEYPNWSLKMKYTTEQLRNEPEAQAFCRMFRTLVDRAGRNQCAPWRPSQE